MFLHVIIGLRADLVLLPVLIVDVYRSNIYGTKCHFSDRISVEGLDAIKAMTNRLMTPTVIFNPLWRSIKKMGNAAFRRIAGIARYFAFLLIMPCFCQRSIGGPNLG